MRNLFLIGGLFMLLSVYAANNRPYIFEKISPESGFVFDAIHTIAQDSNGLVWFGTAEGLYFYNTTEVRKIKIELDGEMENQVINILNIYNDKSCMLWICTDRGLFKFSPEMNQCIPVNLTGDLPANNYSVLGILQLDDERFILNINGKLFSFVPNTSAIKVVDLPEGFRNSVVSFQGLGHGNSLLIGTQQGKVFESTDDYSRMNLLYASDSFAVRAICYESGKYYIGFDGSGVEVINLMGNKIEEFKERSSAENKLPNNRVRQIIRRENGQIWIGTYDGIMILSPEGNQIVTSNERNGLPHNSIYVFFQDQHDGIWIGTWAGGIAYYSDYNYRFQHFKRVPFKDPEINRVITCFGETNDNNILIGSDNAGLVESTPLGYTRRSIELKSLQTSITKIKSMTTRDGVNFWLGTFDEGLWYYNLLNYRLEKLESPLFRSGMIVSTLWRGDKNDLWIGTRGQGLYKYDLVKKTISRITLGVFTTNNLLANGIWKIYRDSRENLWICSDAGLFVKGKDETGFRACSGRGNSDKIVNTTIYTICEDSLHRMWVGTKAMGLYLYYSEMDSVQSFTNDEVSFAADIYSIIKDANHDMWIATNKGLFRHSIKEHRTKHFSETDGLSGNLYSPNAAFLNSSGILYFGTPNGYSVIDPSNIKENPIAPDVFLSKVLINNTPFEREPGVQLKVKHVADLKNLTLNHNQNSLTFNFVTNNFIKPSKNRFKYRLVNYQDEWVETERLKDITFTKIPSGSYVLEVYGSNNDNVWNVIPFRLQIKIESPFWQTWYAYFLYLLFAISLFYVIARELLFRVKVKKEIISERYNSEASELLHKEKLKFFTNVSHEFRTPLTLIISPLNNLLVKFQNDASILNQLKIIIRNADRLQRLTNQILDFRLMEVGKMKVNVSKTDVVDICKIAYSCFEIQIKEKQINFVFTSSFKNHFVMADPDMIEKIVYNLIGNAVKFSNEKGQIILSIEKKKLEPSDYDEYTYTGSCFYGNALSIRVQDYGIGINPELLPNIFDRFIKTPDQNETGTGIGLNICQEYARLNDANIIVQSKLNEGTTFTLNLPITQKLEYKRENVIVQPQFDVTLPDEVPEEALMQTEGNLDIVLLAEDNDDLRLYLKNYLSSRFKVLTAKNGTQAIEIATEIIPDIIITDILMPGMDGIGLTKTIKKNPKTSHIPIIVLTALSENDYQRESILQGADAFLTKPIDSTTLLAQIDNILNSRDLLKKKFERPGDDQSTSQKSTKESFMQVAEKIIEKNMQNPQFDVTQLAEELNFSKSTVHRKIKRYTNQSTSEFIRDIRLKNAIKLLKDAKYNMDEISFFVGFNSTSYFIRSFKKKYGKTPKEFGKSI